MKHQQENSPGVIARQELAKQYGLAWKRRDYSRDYFDAGDDANRCLSVANHCLYGWTYAVFFSTNRINQSR